MEEKNEQGPSGITIVSQASVPGLSDLQNYIYWTPERVRALAEQNMRDRLARHPETALFKN